jgi:hypothetical protein
MTAPSRDGARNRDAWVLRGRPLQLRRSWFAIWCALGAAGVAGSKKASHTRDLSLTVRLLPSPAPDRRAQAY